jgi:hypothetical protein
MATMIRLRGSKVGRQVLAGLPLFLLPIIAILISSAWPAWGRMWALAFAIYAGFKWLTLATSPAASQATWGRQLGYLFLWVGMDAGQFFATRSNIERPRVTEVFWAAGQLTVGVWLFVGLAPRLIESWPYAAGWVAMTGIVSVLHFGVAHLLSVIWRSVGVNARPIMEKPVFARSLADFWGRRWNLAFRDLMHAFVFRPLVPVIGGARATLTVFIVSGLIHDAVISLTARGGWGLPTLYFLIQAVAAFFERSAFGLPGWLFAAAVVVVPAGLLFHGPFIANVVVPMIGAIQGLMQWT